MVEYLSFGKNSASILDREIRNPKKVIEINMTGCILEANPEGQGC